MNAHIKLEITNAILVSKNLNNTCRIAAMKDDGIIDKDEKKVLNKLSKATDKYIKELNKIIENEK